MKKRFIKINGIADVTAFVKMASQVEGDVTLYRGKYVVDGTSLLGVFSVDPSEGVMVEYPENEEVFDEFVKNFECGDPVQ